jgi:alcohol dehydrogenase class IV
MVVTDPGVINAGWAEVVERLIKGTGIPFVVFSELTLILKIKKLCQGLSYIDARV